MLRALSTAATGMEAQELQMDVIANNLANVNTAGFKKARVALARKMAVVLHRMWLDETDFGQLKAV